MRTPQDVVIRQLEASIEIHRRVLNDRRYISMVCSVGKVLAERMREGSTVMLFGNGGSAADAQHLAAELAGRYTIDRPSLAALSLTTNTSSLTAIANDYSYTWIFARQLEGLAKKGDVAIGISTSGNSKNVLKAMEVAR